MYALLTFLTMSWLILVYGLVFGVGLGLSYHIIFIVFLLSLIGSNINIPLFYVKSYKPIIRAQVIRAFLIDFIVPTVDWIEQKTLIAANLGGCVLPIILSSYLVIRMIDSLGIGVLLPLFVGIIVNSFLIHAVSRPIEGLGIVTPALLPPIFTVIITSFLLPFGFGRNIFAVAYVIGTFGSLIGADLMNLNKIPELGAPVASIGGAGIFDGIFLNGIFAVILAMIYL